MTGRWRMGPGARSAPRAAAAAIAVVAGVAAMAIAVVAGVAAMAAETSAARTSGAETAGAPGTDGGSARIAAALGSEIAGALRAAARADAARLSVIGVAEAERRTFGAGRIAGYPVRGRVRAVPAKSLAALVGTLLDDGSYDFDTVIRCRNSTFVGARFQAAPQEHGQEREQELELALGQPCNQAVWAFRKRGGAAIERRGALLSPNAAAAVASALGVGRAGAGPRAP